VRADVIVPKEETAEKQIWEDEQANSFICSCKDFLRSYSTLFVMLLKTGLRVGEALALRWTDIDLDQGVLHVARTVKADGSYGPPKTKRSVRKVSFDGGTLKMLQRHKIHRVKEKLRGGEGYNRDSLIFTTRTGRRPWLSHGRAVLPACLQDLSGSPYITIHGLRHTHATMLLNGGHSVIVVAERLGDTPETISMIYGHATPRNQLEILKTIEQAYE
jgi:integrase